MGLLGGVAVGAATHFFMRTTSYTLSSTVGVIFVSRVAQYFMGNSPSEAVAAENE